MSLGLHKDQSLAWELKIDTIWTWESGSGRHWDTGHFQSFDLNSSPVPRKQGKNSDPSQISEIFNTFWYNRENEQVTKFKYILIKMVNIASILDQKLLGLVFNWNENLYIRLTSFKKLWFCSKYKTLLSPFCRL